MIQFLRRFWLVIQVLKGIIKMANTIAEKIQALTDQVANTEAGEASVIVYLNGVPALIQHAVDTALTLPELQKNLTDLQGRLQASAAAVAAALAAAPKDVPPVPPVDPGPGPAAVAIAPVTVAGTGTVGDGSGPA